MMNGICKLCNEEKELRKNSHIIPVFLLKNMHGERDKEVSVTISSAGFHDYYIGRLDEEKVNSILINKEDLIRQNPYSKDFILCNTCENYLGQQVESVISNMLDSVRSNQNRIDQLQEVAFFKFFVLTIIWRCSITKFSEFSLPLSIENRLQNLISKKFMFNSFSESSIQSLVNQFPMQINLIPNPIDKEKAFVVVDKYVQSPYYFLFVEFVCLFYGKPKSTKKLPLKFFGFERLIKKKLYTGTIEMVDTDIWNSSITNLVEKQINDSYQSMGKHAESLFIQLFEKTPPPEEVDKFLKYYVASEEFKIDQYTPENFLKCFKQFVLTQVEQQ
ncbi:MAG: hypothetical protein ACO1O6_15120 [Bacteroidota bacterium]